MGEQSATATQEKDVVDPPLRQLSKLLWEERQVLADLLFKLEEAHLLLAARRQTWLPRATAEIQDVLDELDRVEDRRQGMVAAAGTELGLGETPTLSELVASCVEPWKSTLGEHRRALLGAVERIVDATTRNRSALMVHLAAVGDALAMLGVERHHSYGDENRSVAVAAANARVLDTRA